MITGLALFRTRAIWMALIVLFACAAQSSAAIPARIDLFVGDSRVVDAETTRIAVGNGKLVGHLG
jgi:hypothetical protein